MRETIEEFIHRRFPVDCNWLNGNCYFFAVILKSVFSGTIYYDQIEGHFIVLIDGAYYDWSGMREYDDEYQAKFINWEICHLTDTALFGRLVTDCIL